MDPHTARLREALRQFNRELVLYERARTVPQQSEALSAARKSPRRHSGDQRHDLRARPSAGLRQLGGPGLRRLGLGQRTVLLQIMRGPGARAGCLSRRWRARVGLGPAVQARARRGVPWRFRKARSAAQSRFQRRHTARHWLRPDHHAKGPPMDDGFRISPRSCEAERQCRFARDGREDRARRKAGGRRGLAGQVGAAGGARAAR
jgi:hypothetical protein